MQSSPDNFKYAAEFLSFSAIFRSVKKRMQKHGCNALISGHHGLLSPGNDRGEPPAICTCPQAICKFPPTSVNMKSNNNISSKQKKLVHLFSAHSEVQLYTL